MKLNEKVPILNAHACGGWRGLTYVNSREAFLHSYKVGFRNIEVDVACTSDDRFVIRHGAKFGQHLKENYSLVEFYSLVYKTPMTFADVIELMQRFIDLKVMFDFHPGLFNRNCPEMMSKFAKELINAGDDICDRSLIEVYSAVNAAAVIRTGFKNVQFGWMNGQLDGRIDLAMPPPPLNDFDKCMRFCAENKIKCVSIPASCIRDNQHVLDLPKQLGLTIYSCGWKSVDELMFARKCGVDYATVDFLLPGGYVKNFLAHINHAFWRRVRKLKI